MTTTGAAGSSGASSLEDRGQRFRHRVATERPDSRQHLVHHEAEREDVRSMVDWLGPHLLVPAFDVPQLIGCAKLWLTLSDGSTYIHGTAPSEQQRLATLNGLTNAAFLEFLRVQPRMRVLEVGSGIGLLTCSVARSAPDVQVVGVEQSFEQIRNAATDPAVQYIQSDAHRLEFADGSFDLVYARYVLEHVARPETVLRELRRVTRRGCRVVACENDESLLRFDPECPVFDTVWKAFQQHQQNLGGDSHIGRRLYGLFRRAGLSSVELSVQPEIHWQGSAGFVPWLRNLIGNVESARKGLIRSGLCSEQEIDAGIAEITALFQNDQASSVFVWNRAVGIA